MELGNVGFSALGNWQLSGQLRATRFDLSSDPWIFGSLPDDDSSTMFQ
jgi:hypothetical protein